MNNLRDAKALHLNHMIGDYEVVIEVQAPRGKAKFFGYINVSLEVALRYVESWGEYEDIKVKTVTIKEVTE